MKIRAPFYDGDSILREGPVPDSGMDSCEVEVRAPAPQALVVPSALARFRAWLSAHFSHRAPQRG